MVIEIGTYGNGEAELFMTVRPDMHNGAFWLQGGLFTALCDEAMAPAFFTVLEEGAGIAILSESTFHFAGRPERQGQGYGKGCQKRQKRSFYGRICHV